MLFLGELKGPGDSTGLEWELHLSSYFCGVTWYSSLAFFMYLLFKFIPHEYSPPLFLSGSLSFSISLSVGSPAAPVCHWALRWWSSEWQIANHHTSISHVLFHFITRKCSKDSVEKDQLDPLTLHIFEYDFACAYRKLTDSSMFTSLWFFRIDIEKKGSVLCPLFTMTWDQKKSSKLVQPASLPVRWVTLW